MGPCERTQTAAIRRLPRRRYSRRGAEVDKGEKESLIYCGLSTAAADHRVHSRLGCRSRRDAEVDEASKRVSSTTAPSERERESAAVDKMLRRQSLP